MSCVVGLRLVLAQFKDYFCIFDELNFKVKGTFSLLDCTCCSCDAIKTNFISNSSDESDN